MMLHKLISYFMTYLYFSPFYATACMPCCQKDHDGWWKRSSKDLGLSIGPTMDLLSAGKMMAWETGAKSGVKYAVKMKLIDEKISPLQNRIIVCKAVERTKENEDTKTQLAHAKLTKAYRRAHRQSPASNQLPQPNDGRGESQRNARVLSEKDNGGNGHCIYLFAGFLMGVSCSLVMNSKSRKY